jgi:DNA-binding SARP family transcriptional activator
MILRVLSPIAVAKSLPTMARLSVCLLGSFQVRVDDRPLTDFRSDKVRALWAYLIVEADRPHSRDALAGLLWPDMPDQAARNNVRLSLHRLRQTLGDTDSPGAFLHVTPDAVQFNPASAAWLDVAEFTACLSDCERHAHRHLETCATCMAKLQEAAELYHGDFLTGFFLDGCVVFSEWVVVRREGLHRKALDTLYHLAQYHYRRGEYDRALDYARRQLALEPWREEAHRQVMSSLAHSGQQRGAGAVRLAARFWPKSWGPSLPRKRAFSTSASGRHRSTRAACRPSRRRSLAEKMNWPRSPCGPAADRGC